MRDGRQPALQVPAAGGSNPRRALAAAGIGNAVEWYDFALYGAFATVLARTHFPGDREAGLLATFAVFATAFVVRPVGALLFGGWGDRRGRRHVLARLIVLMSLATAGVGVLPGYASIGLLAPCLLILLRLAQGLSAGGEAGAASAFAVEYAPAGRRGWYGGWIWATVALGLALATAAAALFAGRLPRGGQDGWAWRLPFLAALPIGLIGLYLRLRLDETPGFRAIQRTRAMVDRPVGAALRAYRGRILAGLALAAAASLTFNTFFIYLPSQLVTDLGVPLPRALAGALLGLVAMAVLSPVVGRLSDRVGRKPLLAAATLGLAGLTLPVYLLVRRGGAADLVLGYLALGAALSCFVLPSFLAELFPTRVRASGLAITYGVGSALFGGTAPLAHGLLLRRTGNPLLPAYYAIAVSLLAAVAALSMRETAFQPLDADAASS